MYERDSSDWIREIFLSENLEEEKKMANPTFHSLLEKMEEIHNRKLHDYASNDNPYGNYHFAGMLSKLFNNPEDAGFVGRIGEKLYRLSNIENNGKNVLNESIEDTEIDICVIVLLWMSDRNDRRTQLTTKIESRRGAELKEKIKDNFPK